jgi:hypothetical protein
MPVTASLEFPETQVFDVHDDLKQDFIPFLYKVTIFFRTGSK